MVFLTRGRRGGGVLSVVYKSPSGWPSAAVTSSVSKYSVNFLQPGKTACAKINFGGCVYQGLTNLLSLDELFRAIGIAAIRRLS